EVVRLPTEAEWEYACRAGSNTAYHFGNEVNELPKYAWFNRFLREQHKPGDSILPNPWKKKLPNMWGLYDMHGCVWEWCTDYYHDSYEGAPTDGSAWLEPETKTRVVRGGSYLDGDGDVRSASRRGVEPTKKSDAIGFRCVLAEKTDAEE